MLPPTHTHRRPCLNVPKRGENNIKFSKSTYTNATRNEETTAQMKQPRKGQKNKGSRYETTSQKAKHSSTPLGNLLFLTSSEEHLLTLRGNCPGKGRWG